MGQGCQVALLILTFPFLWPIWLLAALFGGKSPSKKSSTIPSGYYQDKNGRWHDADGHFVKDPTKNPPKTRTVSDDSFDDNQALAAAMFRQQEARRKAQEARAEGRRTTSGGATRKSSNAGIWDEYSSSWDKKIGHERIHNDYVESWMEYDDVEDAFSRSEDDTWSWNN